MNNLLDFIDTSRWEWWKIEELFHLRRGKGIVKQKRKSGIIPYISAKNNNNGLEQLVDTDKNVFKNALGWVNDGDGGVGYCFYHQYLFRPSNHITVLIPKNFKLDENLGLFFSTIITMENKKHSRGFSINEYRAKNTKIKLPTIYDENDDRQIDFQAIRQLIETIKQKHLMPIDNKKTASMGQLQVIQLQAQSKDYSLDTSHWQPFAIGRLFDIKKGKRLIKLDYTKGNTPYIGAISTNNGISAYIGQSPIHQGNVITVNYNGSVGEAFYQPQPFWASDDVNVLYPKGFQLNPYIAMFLITIIKKEKYRFSYGVKWKVERMRKTTINLPVIKNGEPDFDYMEKFIKSLGFEL